DRFCRQSRAEKADTVHVGNTAHRHGDVRLRVAGDHPAGRSAIVLARGSAGPGRRAFRTSAVRWLIVLPLIARGEFAVPEQTIYIAPFVQGPSPEEMKLTRRASRRYGLFAPHLLRAALRQSFVMLRPDIQWKNPVMFVVEVGTTLTLVFTAARLLGNFPHI